MPRAHLRASILHPLAAIVSLVWLCGTASATVSMTMQIGWDGAYRVGRWTPVFVTLADDTARPARNVRMELLTPHDDTFAMRVVQQLAIRPEPTTFIVYLPLTYQARETLGVVRDAGSNKKLAEFAFEGAGIMQANPMPQWAGTAGDQNLVIGASGRRHALGAMVGTYRWTDGALAPSGSSANNQSIRVGFVKADHLPDLPAGYDCLDVLALDGPDLAGMRLGQQQAIAAWVRAGGRLLMWAGETPLPEDSPIVKLLPCSIGQSTTTALTLEDTNALGLASRVDKVTGRELRAKVGARTLPILRDKAVVCCGRAGFGTVAVVSVDGSQLVFPDRTHAVNFWRPVLKELADPSDTPDDDGNLAGDTESRRLVAMQVVLDRLADVPGVGTFDFSYIAIVLIAMMLIVGPIDWFVLRKLGKQPWTWVTTTGWIALITFGALYIGRLYRSGDLYYRTVRLVDQADGQVAGVVDVAGLYSPKTRPYGLETPRDAWCEPANSNEMNAWRQSPRMAKEFVSVQAMSGNRPLPTVVNIWNLHFVQSQLAEAGAVPPVIQASLRKVKATGPGLGRMAGTITNLGATPLLSVVIHTRDGTATLASPVKPRETATIDLPIEAARPAAKQPGQPPMVYRGRYAVRDRYAGLSAQSALMLSAGDLAANRARQIERFLAGGAEFACIYAYSEDVEPALKLQRTAGSPAIEKHYLVTRALVGLAQVENP